jgi:hypothetical protein
LVGRLELLYTNYNTNAIYRFSRVFDPVDDRASKTGRLSVRRGMGKYPECANPNVEDPFV